MDCGTYSGVHLRIKDEPAILEDLALIGRALKGRLDLKPQWMRAL